MSHDIRTPINGIMGMLNIGDHFPEDMEKQAECREKIRGASSFLFELVNDVLDMSKMESGKIELEEVPFDLLDLLDEVVSMIEVQADTELFRDLYNSLLNQNGGERADQYFILADFRSYAAAQKKVEENNFGIRKRLLEVEEAYKDEKGWARMAMLNTACAGKFTSDRTIEEYVDDIWHLDKVFIK